MPEETIGIIGGSDTVTSIIISDHASRHDKDTIIYELPQCQLWYTKPLSENYKGKEIQMWTEHKVYWENVQVINVFVANPTDIPLGFGRPILVDQWKDNKWCLPERKDTTCDLAWQDDAFMIEKAPLLYCFRCELDEFLMPKGKYKVVFNTDSAKFGGNDDLHKRIFNTERKPSHGKEYSIKIEVPKLSCIYLQKIL